MISLPATPRRGVPASAPLRLVVMLSSLALCAVLLSGCGLFTESESTPTSAPLVRSDVPDGINDRFLDPELDPDAWTNRWEVESREIYVGRHDILNAVALEPGDRIADVGAGTGLFIAPFSEAVGPDGRVLAVEISPKFVEHLQGRVENEGLDNVEVILSTETSTELPPGSVDVIYTCDTYHHFEYHEAMLASIHRALRPGGRFIVVDFERIPGVSREWILGHVRAGKEQVTKEILAAGFQLEREVDLDVLEENYVLRFIRP